MVCVALLGGSFDPVHRGHQALARAALTHPGIDALWWLPAGQPWQKLQAGRAPTAAEHRLAMLQLAVGEDPRQRIEPCELQRSGPTYTIDTLKQLQREHPALTWRLVIGMDQWHGLPTWRRWQEVVQAAPPLVALRPGSGDVPEVPQAQRLLMPPMDVSSTAVRERLRQGQDCADLLPEGVQRYIDRHGLYRGG